MKKLAPCTSVCFSSSCGWSGSCYRWDRLPHHRYITTTITITARRYYVSPTSALFRNTNRKDDDNNAMVTRSPEDSRRSLDRTSSSSTASPSSSRRHASPSSHTSGRAPTAGDKAGKGGGLPVIKVKKKAPWGAQQLRDAWSEDAMSKLQAENMSERIHRSYRYHPDEEKRYYLKYAAFLTIPCIALGASAGYYYHEGKAIWKGDPQHLLNLLRAADTSPRSKLYLYRLEEQEELPLHVRAYRTAHLQERYAAERRFRVCGSAFASLSEDDLRRLEKEKEEEEERGQESVPAVAA